MKKCQWCGERFTPANPLYVVCPSCVVKIRNRVPDVAQVIHDFTPRALPDATGAP